MLILPPFQRNGLCAKLLNSIYKHYATKSDVIDITGICVFHLMILIIILYTSYYWYIFFFVCYLLVESPNDEFQLVRDFVDATNFHHLKSFDKEKLKKLHYQEMVEEFKYLYKVNQVYFIILRITFK